MDRLIPLDVSIRKHQQKQKNKDQKNQMEQKWNTQQFTHPPEPSDKNSAYRDSYTAEAYAKIKSSKTQMKNEMLHATSTSPYNQPPKEPKRATRRLRESKQDQHPNPSSQKPINDKRSKTSKGLRFGVKPPIDLSEHVRKWGV